MKKPGFFEAASRNFRRTVGQCRSSGKQSCFDGRFASGLFSRTLALLIVAALWPFSIAMAEIRQDSWVGMDKANHFGVSAQLGMFGASLAGKSADSADQILYGTLIGALPGLAKEIYDIGRPGSTASIKDMAWNLLGAAAGSMSSKWFSVAPITYRDRVDGFRVQIRFDF
jgi:uncharacterized protein YfiM (DUF2279 family)